MSHELVECIDYTTTTYRTCYDVINYCLEMGDAYAHADHIKVLQDCATICKTNLDFMLSDSEFADNVSGLCAQICDATADSCEEFDDEHMMALARLARKTAQTCRNMALSRGGF